MLLLHPVREAGDGRGRTHSDVHNDLRFVCDRQYTSIAMATTDGHNRPYRCSWPFAGRTAAPLRPRRRWRPQAVGLPRSRRLVRLEMQLRPLNKVRHGANWQIASKNQQRTFPLGAAVQEKSTGTDRVVVECCCSTQSYRPFMVPIERFLASVPVLLELQKDSFELDEQHHILEQER